MRARYAGPAIRTTLTLRIAGLTGCCAAAMLCGCSSSSDSNAGSGAAAPPLPPLAAARIASLPGPSPHDELFVKPGHWTSTWVEAKSDEGDFRGTLEGEWVYDPVAPLTPVLGRVASPTPPPRPSGPLGFPPSQFRLRFVRPLVVPQGRVRGAELLMLAPDDVDLHRPGPNDDVPSRLRETVCRIRLDDEAALRSSYETQKRLTVLGEHQALFVVLAAEPSRYAFFSQFDAVSTPHDPYLPLAQDSPYRTVVGAEETRALVPSSVFAWTTTAYVLWDGYDLAKLSAAQLQALLDWLHWGGTLIVAGPGTLDDGACEPLRPWLPAASGGTLELDAAALAPLAELTADGVPLATSRKWPGLRLRPVDEAHILLGTAEAPLIVERRIGRGRIVATAFRPSQGELLDWPSYAGVFNTHLMRRLPRMWRLHAEDPTFAAAVWDDRGAIPAERERHEGKLDPWYDPTRTSGVRFYAHDAAPGDAQHASYDAQPPVAGGVAAWREDELVATARNVLLSASGIFVPSAATVFSLIALYVFIAVPANWALFYAVERTEWAWYATPVWAVVFMIVAIRTAELDLGFVRSVADTTIVELHPGYDRAHAAHYVSFYNSLGTRYEITGDDPTFCAVPLAIKADAAPVADRRPYELVRRNDDEAQAVTTLRGLVVDSNTVALVRAEQMLTLDGALKAEMLPGDRVRLTNGTGWELRDVAISGRAVGSRDVLPPGATVELRLRPVTNPSDDAEAASTPPPDDDAPAPSDDAIAVEPIRRVLQAATPSGGLLLTAWTPSDVASVAVSPAPSQRRRRTIIVAELAPAPDAPPARERNTRASLPGRPFTGFPDTP